MPTILEWQQVQPQEALADALRRLGEGQVVAFPTDTTYVVVADSRFADAVARLAQAESAAALTVGVRDMADGQRWIPDMSTPARRFAARCWPGPLTLAFPWNDVADVDARLGEATRKTLPSERLCLRAPYHEAIYNAIVRSETPLIFREIYAAGDKPITNAEQAKGETAFDLLLADGATYFSAPASVVEVDGDEWRLSCEGAVTPADLQRMACRQIVFVCTGNTCRSPMAEALCKKLLAERLQCSPEELPARGFNVQSAGISAFPGLPASPEGVEALREWDVDLSGHQSQAISAEQLLQADHVLAMTANHLQALTGHGMNSVTTPQLLSIEGEEISDPIGAEPEVYRACAQQILRSLQDRLDELSQS